MSWANELYFYAAEGAVGRELMMPASTRSHHGVRQVDALDSLILGCSCISGGFFKG